ncbi:uncharacterized protein LOC134132166 [Pungitius pungitius]
MDRVLTWKVRATTAIGHQETIRDTPRVRVSDGSSGSFTSQSRQTVKLPKLMITKYDGEISQWQEFWSQYETAIHRNEVLCKTDKFTYLRSYLTGAAARTIAGLTMTDANYDAAIELLQSRFGRKDIVISAHMSKLLNLNPVKRSSDVTALRHLYDECEIQIRSLESLGVQSDTYGCLLCPVLLQLIPEDIALAYTRQPNATNEWKVPELIQFLQNEVQSRERALQLTRPGHASKDPSPQHKNVGKPSYACDKPRKWSVPSATALHTASAVPRTCVYCDSSDHKPENCSDHTISLAEKDKDAVRFLWMHGPPTKDCKNEVCVLRMNRVVFGVSPSPFLLAATIRKHLKLFDTEQPKAAQILSDSLYVDDFISSSPTVQEALHVTTTAKDILAQAGMDLCKWVTNSPDLRAMWKETGVELTGDTESCGNVLKVLGLVWRPERDDFVFDQKGLIDILRDKENTKRSVLQTSARIFDPIGFLTPFTIRVKCLFQEMWERGLSWDEPLPIDLTEKWEQWCMELPLLHLMAIPRWYHIEIQQESHTVKLHVYCDASEKAYSAVAYLQGKNKQGETVTSFVASKSRVAPLKKMTLPRLELMGALIGARLGHSFLKPLNMEKSQLQMWTDSMITLHWIRSSAQRWKPFVANRVTEIQGLTNPETWSHCAGKMNPADLPTRGQHAQSLIESQLWWSGPASLSTAERELDIDDDNVVNEVNTELKSKYQTVVQFTSAEQTVPLLNLERYGRLKTVLRITAWVKRFVTNTRSCQRVQGELTSEELIAAEMYWVKATQERCFSSEISQLKSKLNVKRDSKIKDLKPFLDENGLLSVGGRLQHSDFSFREQHPWVLPTNHKYSELLVHSCHEKVMHSGVRDTLIQLREHYWILRGRQLVKRIVSSCYICRKLKVKAAKQITAPLPRDRVTESPPFEVTGVDFAGPLYVRSKGQPVKAYITLFTCAVTRAVHLELVSDQTTENFLLALKRFIARRGLCKIIYSDNAKTFKRADKDLKELWQNIKGSKLTEFFTEKGITWKFIAERAAWWGGFW